MDLTKYDIVFFIVACTEPMKEVFSVFTKQERFQQLVKTVESCKKFKNSISVISEGSSLSEDEIKIFPENTIVLQHEDSIKVHLKSKQFGSLKLWEEGLNKIEVRDDAIIVFLAGRYYLNEHFTVEMNADYSFKKDISWVNPNLRLVQATCFKVKGNKKNEFIEIIKNSKKFIDKFGLDVEHAIHFFIKEKSIQYVEKVECDGLVGATGKGSIYNK